MPLMSLRQREQMRQLAYMPQVPVPVLSGYRHLYLNNIINSCLHMNTHTPISSFTID